MLDEQYFLGQALVLLTKHDFLRRSPDGGEILYYALQKLISKFDDSLMHMNNSLRYSKDPKKFNPARINQNRSLNTSPRIVEMDSDAEDLSESLGATLSVNPIVEEPDDFPSNSKSNEDTSSRMHRQQQYPHAFAYRTVHMRPPVYAMPTNAYYQAHYHQQAYPQAYVYAQPTHPHHHMHHPHHHHAHPHMNQQQAQQFYHPHAHSQAHAQAFIHQFYPMMSAQGILIEVIENDGINHVNENGANISMNENSTEIPEQLYLVTINGQRQVMTEDQIRRLVADIHQQQLYQTYQQQTASAQQQQQQAQQNFQAPPPQPPPPTQSTQDNLFYAP